MWLFDVNYGDGLIRPKVSYAVDDELNTYAGADYFYGSDKRLFGRFDRKDRVIVGVGWSFRRDQGLCDVRPWRDSPKTARRKGQE